MDEHFAAMDIGWAQELFARRGVLSAIQLQLVDPRRREAVTESLRALVPPDAQIATPAQRGQQVTNMLGGFQLNLTAMSLVSLLVGMFLIYNTVSASVVRRRNEIGILRSLGVTRNEVRALFLAEALALGALGVALGLAGGVLLARVLVGTVAETISSLYVLLSVQELAVTPWMFASAAVLGLASVVIAAWLPAAAAAKMDPVRALARRLHHRAGDRSLARLALGRNVFARARGGIVGPRSRDWSSLARVRRRVLRFDRLQLSRPARNASRSAPRRRGSSGSGAAVRSKPAWRRRMWPAPSFAMRSRSPRWPRLSRWRSA